MLIRGYLLGIQSYTLRVYTTPADLIQAVTACGLNAMETFGREFDIRNPESVDAALALYRAHGITITSYAVAHLPNNEEACRPYFEFARKAGFPAIGADPEPDALSLLEGLCAEYDVKLAVHNHGRKHRYGTYRELDALFARTSDAVGLCLDTAFMLDVGEDPSDAAEKYADRLYGLHIKDFIFHRNGVAEDIIVGDGNLDVPRLYDTLAKIGFSGYTTLEYGGDMMNPIPSVQACIAKLQEVNSRD